MCVAKPPPTCKPSSVIKRQILAGCKGCPDSAIVAFKYQWPKPPTCVNKCMARELKDVCKVPGFTKADIEAEYKSCCYSCGGTPRGKNCVCYGYVGNDGICH